MREHQDLHAGPIRRLSGLGDRGVVVEDVLQTGQRDRPDQSSRITVCTWAPAPAQRRSSPSHGIESPARAIAAPSCSMRKPIDRFDREMVRGARP